MRRADLFLAAYTPGVSQPSAFHGHRDLAGFAFR